MNIKTLIGKDNVLFLQNDAADELNVHCNNVLKITDITLSRYTFNNYILFVYPNKSLIYKNFLPKNLIVKYRPALNIYINKLDNKVYDLYKILKSENDVYYKTDTHINIKGNYFVYKYFIKIINDRLNLNIQPKLLELKVKNCELKTLPYAIGDLTWPTNLGNQVLNDSNDNFYFNEDITWFYSQYKISNNNNIKFLNYCLVDETSNICDNIVDWNIISKYIIHVLNNNCISLKIIIFYDSFFVSTMPLYFNLFNEIYFVKNVYSNDIINLIKPDYVFEFRVERFLF